MIAEVKEYLTLAALIGALLSPVFLLWLKSQFATKPEVDAIRERFADADTVRSAVAAQAALSAKLDILEDRVGRIEGKLEHLPSKDSVHDMALSLSSMRGEVQAMAERLAPIARTAERLQEFLISQAERSR